MARRIGHLEWQRVIGDLPEEAFRERLELLYQARARLPYARAELGQNRVVGSDRTRVDLLLLEQAIAAAQRLAVVRHRTRVVRVHLLEHAVQKGPSGLGRACHQVHVTWMEEHKLDALVV